MQSRDLESAAAVVIASIDSPVAHLFRDAGGWVDWPRVDTNYRALSSGEKALVDLAKHLSFRQPAIPNGSFLMALSRVDQPHREVVLNALLALLEDDANLRVVTP